MIVRAKYALLAPGEVRRDVRLEIDGNRIVAVHTGFAPHYMQPDVDLGMAVITPGWVNAHTHLELEFCDGAVPKFESFIDWLQQIRDLKGERDNRGTTNPQASLAAHASSGCTTVIDHHTADLEWDAIEAFGLRYYPFREYFEFNNHAPDLDQMRRRARRGYAAHSPYTASIEMALACRQLADEARLPLSVHLAETPAEVEFLEAGVNEEIISLLKRAHAYDDDWQGTQLSPVRYFAEQGVLTGPTYAIHLNYPQPGDIDLLAALRPTVVFCPATHAYFRHPRHSVAEFLAAGIPVALGTDSLASNSQLSPLREAATLRQNYPGVTAPDVFRALTTAALQPLGLSEVLGRLEPGYFADFAAYQLAADPLRGGALDEHSFGRLLDAVIETQRAALTVCNGRVVHSSLPETSSRAA